MNMPLTGRPIGLDGIPAAVTALSLVDGENGVLVIAGLPVERLAESLRFEAVAARLWRIADHARLIACQHGSNTLRQVAEVVT